jgi:HD-GYP domain-containing protein (c-di-GMP phosphodiesterase class II)
MIVEESGNHFDPVVIAAFNEIEDATLLAIGRDVG